jgi:hypothetical protein
MLIFITEFHKLAHMNLRYCSIHWSLKINTFNYQMLKSKHRKNIAEQGGLCVPIVLNTQEVESGGLPQATSSRPA